MNTVINTGTKYYQANSTGEGAKAVGTDSIAAGPNSVATGDRSVALGANSKAIGNDSVALGAGSVADRANTVSVGSVGNERQITNVAPGTRGTDAVNLNQLNSVQNSLNNRIDDLNNVASRGIASATALTQIPEMNEHQRMNVGLGVGHFNGVDAVAVGAKFKVGDNARVNIGAGISGGVATYGAGVGFGW
ncbi:YadA family autotransporter adhesin [Aquirhabdus parva]|uniref:YadA family autotransporter adhesin n=1 Tax=Aquirhabdus parva TaxID=2283318 RepID=UPI0013B3C014|nr:YadA-like family protein [Aquirhabdus parva]